MILEDDERTGQIQKVVDKLRTGHHTKSSIEDVGAEKSIKFSEESSRTISELGNIELHELGQISKTVQGQSCLKHIPEGLIFCSCGLCLQPWWRTNTKNQSQIWGYDSSLLPCTSKSLKRWKTRRSLMAKKTTGKQKMPKQEQEWTVTTPSCSSGRETKSTENLRKFTDGQKDIVDPWSTHDDRHLLQRNLAAELARKHHLLGIQWWWSARWTDASAKRL